MKSYLLIILFFCSISLTAQTYHPFPTKNAMWTELYWRPFNFDEPVFHCYALKDNDTTINGKLYHKIYHSVDTLFTEDKLCGGIREENKKIYFYPIDSLEYTGYPIFPNRKEEFILYDFSLKEGDLISSDTFRLLLADYPGNLKVFKIDSILVGQEYRKAFHFGLPSDSEPYSWAIWIEGIGSIRGLLFPTIEAWPENGLDSYLICNRQGNNKIFHISSGFNDCFYLMPSSVIKTALEPDIKVTPNPIHTRGLVEFGGRNFSKLRLVNMYGMTLCEYNVKGMTSIEIYKENLSPGINLLVIEDLNGNFCTAKLIFE